MKTVVVKRVAPSPLYKAFVDGKALKFVNDEAAARADAGEHALTWVVHGPAGSGYAIQITAPAESRFKHEAKLDEAEKDAGLHWFRVLGVSAILLAALAGGVGRAQTLGRPPVTGMQHFADPSLTSPLSVPSAAVILEGTTSSKTGTARVGFQAADFLLDARLSGPLDEGEARPADLSGLRNSATLDLGLGWIRWNPRPDPAAMRRVCDAYRSETGRTVEVCTRNSLPAGDWRRRFDEAVDYGTPLLFSLRGAIGRKSFTTTDSTTFARSTSRRTNGSVVLAVGVYRSAVGFFQASYRYEVAYTAGAAVQVCRPLGSGGALRCEDERLRGPGREASSLAQVEYRRLIGTAVGLRPRFTYRTRSRTWGYEVPLYFLRGERGFTGGVTLGWRSDRRESTLSAFVGDVLGLVSVPE